MEKTAFLTVQAAVETQNVDFLGLWRPSRMLEHLIDTASKHAAILGYSYEDLVQQRIVWVLSRLNVHFYRRPVLGRRSPPAPGSRVSSRSSSFCAILR